jgi:hydroxyacylglutathione hydrolase
MRVVPVPCLADNYAYLVICEDTGDAAVVDPSDAAPVLAAAGRERARLSAIWNTHHHWDHTGGNEELARRLGGAEIAGHVSDARRTPGLSRGLGEGDEVAAGRVRARALHVPGHTTGAIAYVGGGHVFTGDTLFLAGCGRLFEGTPAMMFASLRKLASLPGETLVWPGHEYTRKNLAFARAVAPKDEAVRERAGRLGEAGGPTVPGTIAEEIMTNPFLRAASVEDFAALRARKDRC